MHIISPVQQPELQCFPSLFGLHGNFSEWSVQKSSPHKQESDATASDGTSPQEKIELDLLPHQHFLLNNYGHEELALPGGLGSGKTTFACLWHHDRATKNVDCTSWWVAPDYPLCYVGHKTYLEMLTNLGYIEGVHYRAKRTPGNLGIQYLCFPHSVEFRTTNQNLVGANLAHITFDECGDCLEEGVQQAIGRVRDPKAKYHQKLFIGAPQGLNHYYLRFSGDMKSHGPIRWNEKQMVLQYRTYWNHYLPPSYISNLVDEYGSDELFIRAWIFGDFVPLSQNNCFKFDEREHVVDCKLRPDVPVVYLGWDFNVGQVAFVIMQEWDNKFHCCAEAPNRVHDTEDACDAILKLMPPSLYQRHEIIIDGDASGHSGSTRGKLTDYDIIITRLRQHYTNIKVVAPRYNTSVQHRIISTNRLFNQERLYIDRGCPYTIDGLNKTTWDNHGGIKKSGKDTWSHRPDALSYVASRREPIAVRKVARLR